jgi:cyclic pyranopterin phosphate synthase
MIKVCLFDNREVSLLKLMRSGESDDALREVVSAAVGKKRFSHLGMETIAKTMNRPMIKLGG